MKSKLTITLLLIAVAAYSQTDKEDNKAAKRISSSHVKSVTQTMYKYVYDIASGTNKPSAEGMKTATFSFDRSGNVIEDIEYDQYGHVDSKTTYKNDARGNHTEANIYGSDGTLTARVVITYNKDTVTLKKVYNAKGALIQTVYSGWGHITISKKAIPSMLAHHLSQYADTGVIKYGNTFYDLLLYDAKDSNLTAMSAYIYDKQGNLVLDFEYGAQYLTSGETYKYDDQGQRIENNHYNKDDEWEGKTTYKYGEKGAIIEAVQWGYNGLPERMTSFKNDANGNNLQGIVYDKNNQPKQMIKYTYQYYQQ